MLFEAKHIEKSYAAHKALDDVSISVPEAGIFGLLGPNGAGKTTLIRIINQIIAPDKGELFFRGQPLKPEDVNRIGYLPEERGLYKKMKVGEQAVYLAQLKGLSASAAKKELFQWFEKFGIADWWDKKIEDLSKGMAQKIQFIVTIIHKPDLLIFDEPFSGFDPINVNLLKQEILNLKANGTSIIFSTHNMASVEEICDNIALVNRSKIILEGDVQAIKNTYKQNLFEAQLCNVALGLKPAQVLSDYHLLSHDIVDGQLSVQVQLKEQQPVNTLLSQLMRMGDLLHFREVLPSMNDIFIQQVQKD